ncbi:hypothetical protein BH18ACT7_BH18ACT7_15640 [soil metagenome]
MKPQQRRTDGRMSPRFGRRTNGAEAVLAVEAHLNGDV